MTVVFSVSERRTFSTEKESELFQAIISPLVSQQKFSAEGRKKKVFWMSWNVQKSGFRRRENLCLGPIQKEALDILGFWKLGGQSTRRSVPTWPPKAAGKNHQWVIFWAMGAVECEGTTTTKHYQKNFVLGCPGSHTPKITCLWSLSGQTHAV